MADEANALDLGSLLIHLQADSSEFASGFSDAENISSTVWKLITDGAELGEIAVAAAFVGMAAAAVKAWSDIETATTQASQRMGNTNADLVGEMEKTAQSIATSGATSVTELTDAYKTLADAGYSAQQSIMALPVVDKAATATGNDLTSTIQALTGAQKALGLETNNTMQNTQNLTDLSNTLIKATQESNVTFTQLGQALGGQTGVELKQFGLSMQESVALMASLADAGEPIENTGRTLRTLLETLADSASKSDYAFKQLGIDIYDAGTGKLLPFVTILDNMRTHLSGLSDSQKQSALETLGFTNQTSALAKQLIDSTGSVQAYVQSFQDVNNVTKDAAEQGEQTLGQMISEIYNNIKELALEVGEALTSAVKAAIQTFKDFLPVFQPLADLWKEFVSELGPALIVVIGLVGDAFQGWALIFDSLEVAFDGVWTVIMKTLSGAVVVINAVVGAMLDTIVEGANDAIAALNKVLPAAHQLTQIDLTGFIAKLTSNPLSGAADGAVARLKSDYADLQALANKPLFSDTLQANYNKATASIVKDNQTIVASAKTTMEALQKTASDVSPEQQLQNKVQADFADVGKNGYGYANKTLYPSGAKNDPLTQAQNANMPSTYNDTLTKGLSDQLNQEEAAYKKAQDAIDAARLAGTNTTNKAIEDAMTAHANKIQAIQIALAQQLVENVGSIFNNLTTIAQNTVGTQSGVYKTLFDISKAFAIADSTIKMEQAIAGAIAAFSSGGIAGIIAGAADIASITAQMSNIISTINATTLSGFGGAKATGGPVASGMTYLVGEKGPELFMPSQGGSIIPNDQLGKSNVSVVVNNMTDGTASVNKSKDSNGNDIYTVLIQKVRKDLATDFQNGTGPVNRAVTGAFGLQRGKTQ